MTKLPATNRRSTKWVQCAYIFMGKEIKKSTNANLWKLLINFSFLVFYLLQFEFNIVVREFLLWANLSNFFNFILLLICAMYVCVCLSVHQVAPNVDLTFSYFVNISNVILAQYLKNLVRSGRKTNKSVSWCEQFVDQSTR